MNEFDQGYELGYSDCLDEIEAYLCVQREMIAKFSENAEADDVEEQS